MQNKIQIRRNYLVIMNCKQNKRVGLPKFKSMLWDKLPYLGRMFKGNGLLEIILRQVWR